MARRGWDRLDRSVASLHPAYFALVMSTGVLAVGSQLLGIPTLPGLLLAFNLVAYGALWLLLLVRIARHPRRVGADLASHERGPGFFTVVAATAVVGVQLVLQAGRPDLARACWWLAFGLWAVLTYAVFTALTVRDDKPDLADGINGGWLTAVVATQSLVVLGVLASPIVADPAALALGLVTLWLAGGMLYIWMISLIFYRYLFFRFLPSDLMPPYWINMGAMAISTLAGALLIRAAPGSALLGSLLPFLEGFTLLYWATATWWIPMLLVLGVWRYVVRRVPLTYHPLYWGAVFPLAMYTVATLRLSEALSLPFLLAIPRFSIGAALTAWLLTALGLALTWLRGAATPTAAANVTARGERARRAILAGWLVTLLGVVGCCTVTLRQDAATLVGGLRDGGPFGWLSAVLLAAGVAVWLAGYLALPRDPLASR